MVLTKEQIKLIEKLHKKAQKSELKARLIEEELGNTIVITVAVYVLVPTHYHNS